MVFSLKFSSIILLFYGCTLSTLNLLMHVTVINFFFFFFLFSYMLFIFVQNEQGQHAAVGASDSSGRSKDKTDQKVFFF